MRDFVNFAIGVAGPKEQIKRMPRDVAENFSELIDYIQDRPPGYMGSAPITFTAEQLQQYTWYIGQLARYTNDN